MEQDNEASLREVLAEVSVLDLWAATKTIFSQWGCFAIFLIIATVLDNATSIVTGSIDSLGIPDWGYWLFLIWVCLAFCTQYTSYHDYRFTWYFPKAGWIRSLPLAAYLLIGVQIFRGDNTGADFWAKAAHTAVLAAWWFPFFLGIMVLQIGHGRVMEKRSADRPKAT